MGMRIQTSDHKLHTDALKYAEAVLIQDNYTNSFMNYECVEDPNFDSKTYVAKSEYMIGIHPEFSPDLFIGLDRQLKKSRFIY